jgi:hypothetical protein
MRHVTSRSQGLSQRKILGTRLVYWFTVDYLWTKNEDGWFLELVPQFLNFTQSFQKCDIFLKCDILGDFSILKLFLKLSCYHDNTSCLENMKFLNFLLNIYGVPFIQFCFLIKFTPITGELFILWRLYTI